MGERIWPYFGEFKVHCDKYQRDEILQWTGCRQSGIYNMPSGPREYDVIIPAKQLTRVKQLIQKGKR